MFVRWMYIENRHFAIMFSDLGCKTGSRLYLSKTTNTVETTFKNARWVKKLTVEEVPITIRRSHHVIFLAISPIKGGISPNHTTSGLKRPPHRPKRLDPDHSSPPQRGSLSVGISIKLLKSIQSLSDAARRGSWPCFTLLQDRQRVLNSDPCIWMRASRAVVATFWGSDCKERSERSSIFCVTWSGGVRAEGVIRFITEGRFSAAIVRCPLLGRESRHLESKWTWRSHDKDHFGYMERLWW